MFAASPERLGRHCLQFGQKLPRVFGKSVRSFTQKSREKIPNIKANDDNVQRGNSTPPFRTKAKVVSLSGKVMAERMLYTTCKRRFMKGGRGLRSAGGKKMLVE